MSQLLLIEFYEGYVHTGYWREGLQHGWGRASLAAAKDAAAAATDTAASVVEGEWQDGLPTGWMVFSDGRGGEPRRRRWEQGKLVLEVEGGGTVGRAVTEVNRGRFKVLNSIRMHEHKDYMK
jgi:hypothetical protein